MWNHMYSLITAHYSISYLFVLWCEIRILPYNTKSTKNVEGSYKYACTDRQADRRVYSTKILKIHNDYKYNNYGQEISTKTISRRYHRGHHGTFHISLK